MLGPKYVVLQWQLLYLLRKRKLFSDKLQGGAAIDGRLCQQLVYAHKLPLMGSPLLYWWLIPSP